MCLCMCVFVSLCVVVCMCARLCVCVVVYIWLCVSVHASLCFLCMYINVFVCVLDLHMCTYTINLITSTSLITIFQITKIRNAHTDTLGWVYRNVGKLSDIHIYGRHTCSYYPQCTAQRQRRWEWGWVLGDKGQHTFCQISCNTSLIIF